MKRGLVLVIVFVLAAVLSTTAFAAEQIDLSKMSDDEIIATRVVLDDEIAARGLIREETFYPGVYVGGESIKPGTYILRFNIGELGNISIRLYHSVEDYDNKQYYKSEDFFNGVKGYQFMIGDGEVITLTAYGIGCTMSVRTDKPSWAP